MSDLLGDLTWNDSAVPTDGPVTATGALDKAPPGTHELSCVVCGKELTYAGRGRKPTRCEEHRKTSGKTTRTNTGKNAQLASQATEALAQMNSLSAFGLMMFGMPMTGNAITQADEVFREQAYGALLTQPDLCRKILRAGTTSGFAALAMAYGMLGVAVIPVAVVEIKQRRADAALLAESENHGDV